MLNLPGIQIFMVGLTFGFCIGGAMWILSLSWWNLLSGKLRREIALHEVRYREISDRLDKARKEAMADSLGYLDTVVELKKENSRLERLTEKLY